MTDRAADTIFALSSGAPPAAIAIVRISGPAAFATGQQLAGRLPLPRQAALRSLHGRDGQLLDRALVLAFPGPHSATGEDLLELHLHGGRSVVRAIEAELAARPGLRAADAGEFTRRALGHGRIDLAQAEGLADLLVAETEAARRAALAATEGALSRQVAGWIETLLGLSARAEALIDFADEDDVTADLAAEMRLRREIARFAGELHAAMAEPPVERLHDGVRVVLAGPPNSGKSTLINALVGREVAITNPSPGTTRDRIEAAVQRNGIAYVLIDTAGLRDAPADEVEAIGIARAEAAMATADIVLWLGDDAPSHDAMIGLQAKSDLPDRGIQSGRLAVSAVTGAGLSELWEAIAARAFTLLPSPDTMSLNRRQRACLAQALSALDEPDQGDLLLTAEQLRIARAELGKITGKTGVEEVLDDLFGRFCIGK